MALCLPAKCCSYQTGKLVELQKNCCNERLGAPRTCSVETTLSRIRSESVQQAYNNLEDVASCKVYDDDQVEVAISNLVKTVLEAQTTDTQLHIEFVQSLHDCSKQIWGYRRLQYDLEELRATRYDDSMHSGKLESLWISLVDDESKPYIRISKQWGGIGFQGNDPKTDFRGMGMLGLENLLFLARKFTMVAKHILSNSHHPKYEYSMAIVSINLSHLALRLFNDGTAKVYMYNITKGQIGEKMPIKLDHFHHFYSYLFVEFDQFWLDQKPENVMEFSRILDLFENNVRKLLADRSVSLKNCLLGDII
jgi:hypothetical protein